MKRRGSASGSPSGASPPPPPTDCASRPVAMSPRVNRLVTAQAPPVQTSTLPPFPPSPPAPPTDRVKSSETPNGVPPEPMVSPPVPPPPPTDCRTTACAASPYVWIQLLLRETKVTLPPSPPSPPPP